MAEQRGRPFVVGNTAGKGRPKGSRNKSTMAARELFGEYADAVTKKCLLMAAKGDPTAMRLCMDRLYPARRAVPVRFKLPPIKDIHDVVQAVDVVVQAVSKGKLTPQEGQQILPLLTCVHGILTSEEFGARLKAVEELLSRES